jgi:alpha/beta superfamily hydrolase
MDLPKPKQFANQIIQQMVQHAASGDTMLAARDYMSIRVVFRRMGGSWSKFADGNYHHMELLRNVIASWIQSRGEVQPI